MYSKAIEIDPVDALSYTHLGGVMEKLERFEDAATGNECKETDRLMYGCRGSYLWVLVW
jgi:hypothetical protein